MSLLDYGGGAPFYYDYVNARNGIISPSTVHVKNTALQMYFQRYLLKKALSVYEWKMPKGWAKNYFLYVLYTWGFIAVINTDKYGVIPQAAALKGYDVQYQPTHALIANPLLRGILEPRIGKQCTVIKLQPDYTGVLDRINFYADMLALSAEAAGVNLLNSKLAYVFAASGKTASETFKKLYDKIASGEPAAVVDKSLFNDDGSPNWQIFNQNIKNTYIAGDVLEDMRKWEMAFDTDFGIPNANTEKKERLTTDEVNIKAVEVKTWGELALEELQEGVEKTCEMFNISPDQFSVDWRFKEVEENGTRNAEPAGLV